MVSKVSFSPKLTEVYKTLSHYIVYGGRGMPPHYPISVIKTNWYYSQFWAKELYRVFKKLEKRGIKKEKFAELFWGPSAISHWFYIANPVPFKDLTPKECEEFLEKTVEILSRQRKNDVFCRDQRNILLSQNEVKDLLKDKKFLEIKDSSLKTTLSQLSILLWQYCIFIQGGHRAYSQEFHGPYSLDNGRSLFVREYFNLQPDSVWGFTSNFPARKIRFLEIYRNARIKINMFNLFEISDSSNPYPEEVFFQADSKILEDRKAIEGFFNLCSESLETGAGEVRNFQEEDWVRKIIDMRYLWLKPIKEILGEDWRPSEKTFDVARRTNEAERAAGLWVKNMKAAVMGLPENEAIEKITRMFLDNIYQTKR